jgi:hypothetical protein
MWYKQRNATHVAGYNVIMHTASNKFWSAFKQENCHQSEITFSFNNRPSLRPGYRLKKSSYNNINIYGVVNLPSSYYSNVILVHSFYLCRMSSCCDMTSHAGSVAPSRYFVSRIKWSNSRAEGTAIPSARHTWQHNKYRQFYSPTEITRQSLVTAWLAF